MSNLGQLTVKRVMLTDTGTHDEMVSRAYTTNIKPDDINRLAARMEQGFSSYHEGALAGIAGQMVQPQAAPDRLLTIDSGWGTRRLRFNIVLAYEVNGRATGVFYVYTGYTSYSGISMVSEDLAEDMKFYINNAITVSFTERFNGTTTVPHVSVISNNQVIHHRSAGGGMDINFDPTGQSPMSLPSTMRPADLTRVLATQFGSAHDSSFADTRVGVSFAKSNRDNNLVSRYLARSLSAVDYGSNESVSIQHDPQAGYEIATGMYQEAAVMEDPFIAALDRGQAYTMNGYFTVNDLRNAFPETRRKETIHYYQTDEKDIYNARRGDAATWVNNNHGQLSYNGTTESIIATQLISALPSILIPHLISCCKIEISNMFVGSTGVSVRITDPFALISEIPDYYLRAIIPYAEKAIEGLIVRDLPIPEGLPIRLNLFIDVFGDARFDIGINSYSNHTPFQAPMFADSMFPPIITTDHSHLINVANDIDYVVKATT